MFAVIEQGLAGHQILLGLIRLSGFDAVRGDARYPALLKRMGLS